MARPMLKDKEGDVHLQTLFQSLSFYHLLLGQNLPTRLQGARGAQGLLTWSGLPLPIF